MLTFQPTLMSVKIRLVLNVSGGNKVFGWVATKKVKAFTSSTLMAVFYKLCAGWLEEPMAIILRSMALRSLATQGST